MKWRFSFSKKLAKQKGCFDLSFCNYMVICAKSGLFIDDCLLFGK